MFAVFKEVVKSLGIVFGDIGTSPIYTLSVIFAVIPATLENVVGILSLLLWTLFTLVNLQYAWLAMSISRKGEGGIIVLRETLLPLLNSNAAKGIATLFTFLGISFFIGDGVITPAISILSAVEGLDLIPGLHGINQSVLIFIAIAITIFLFFLQKSGTEKVASFFGPIMFVWFLVLAFLGFINLIKDPRVLIAFNPWYGIKFLLKNKFAGFIVLSKVILCATGGEALYADMGHLGRKPIIYSWLFVFGCLLFIYLGQGVFILNNQNAMNLFFEMAIKDLGFLYIPFVLLSVTATVIASQAVISGIFSVVYQAITTHIMPRLHVEYTSTKMMSQIYLPSINWFLMFLVIFAILKFQYSYNLAVAYGLAASGTMSITAIMLTWIFFLRTDKFKVPIAFIIMLINLVFLAACTYKIPFGAYWSLIISSVPFIFITVYTLGQKKLYDLLSPLELDDFLKRYSIIYQKIPKIPGRAIFLAKDVNTIPTYIEHTMFINNIIYETNVILIVNTQESAYGMDGFYHDDLAQGLKVYEVRIGYMEIMNLEQFLYKNDLNPKVIFYGVEEISTKKFIWRLFILIKKLTPSFVQFYKLPVSKLHGVMVRVEM